MDRPNCTAIPFLRIAPGLVYMYTHFDFHGRKRPMKMTRRVLQEKPAGLYTGILSAPARKKLIRSINLLVAIALPKKAMHFDSGREFTFRVNFITLTLPAPQGDVTDDQLKKICLKSWIEYWKDKLPGLSYVWRAERQKNGNLHFHLCCDRYILYSDLRDTWNNRLAKFHFIDAFEKKHQHRHPNSTDVHGVKNIRNLGAYIAKYMSKTESVSQPISGKVWDCSANLKRKDQCSFHVDHATHTHFERIRSQIPGECFDSEFCSGFRASENLMHKILPVKWQVEYSAYLARIRSIS